MLHGATARDRRAIILPMVEKVEEILLLCANGHHRHALDVLLPALQKSLRSRFAQEELWMGMTPAVDDEEWQHMAEHRQILTSLAQILADRGRDGARKVASRACHCLRDHLLPHFASADRQLAARLLGTPEPQGMH